MVVGVEHMGDVSDKQSAVESAGVIDRLRVEEEREESCSVTCSF